MGFRVGYTADSFDQVFVGVHARAAELKQNLAFQPSLEVGFGDDVTLVAGNADIFYEFSEFETALWSFYAGGGVLISWGDYASASDWNVGLGIAGGARYKISEGKRLFSEVRFGIEDAPDFKISIGLTFF